MKAEECLSDHDSFLRSLGMCTKAAKTKAVIFGPDFEAGTIRAPGDQPIPIAKTIKVLGIMFSYNLSWSAHIKKAVKKAASIGNHVRFIRQWLTKEQKYRFTNHSSLFTYFLPTKSPKSQFLW